MKNESEIVVEDQSKEATEANSTPHLGPHPIADCAEKNLRIECGEGNRSGEGELFRARWEAGMVFRELHPKASVPLGDESAPKYTIDFRSSDQTLDRYKEVITMAGWQLDNSRKNPVVQNAHSY